MDAPILSGPNYEARWLSNASEHERIARSIVDAAEEYLAAFELRANGVP